MQGELETYLASHEADPKVIVSDINGTIEGALATPDVADAPILRLLRPFVRIPHDGAIDTNVPVVVEAVKRNLQGRRRDRSRLWFFRRYAGAVGALLVAALLLGVERERQRTFAESRRLVSEARATLSAPAATQSAILSARAALWMADTPESRSAAMEVLRWLATPIAIFDTGHDDGGVWFAVQRPNGDIIFHSFASPTSTTGVMDRAGQTMTLRRPMACEEMHYSRDGRRVVCRTDAGARVWETSTGTTLLDKPVSGLAGNRGPMALNEHGTALAVADDSSVTVFDVETGTVHPCRAPH